MHMSLKSGHEFEGEKHGISNRRAQAIMQAFCTLGIDVSLDRDARRGFLNSGTAILPWEGPGIITAHTLS
jgi:hypothetical protein